MVSKACVCSGIPWHQDLGLGDPFSESGKMREKNTEARVLAWEGVAIACARGESEDRSVSPQKCFITAPCCNLAEWGLEEVEVVLAAIVQVYDVGPMGEGLRAAGRAAGVEGDLGWGW